MNLVTGKITAFGQPATGFVVKVLERRVFGRPAYGKPCYIFPPNTRLLGMETLDENGRFGLKYAPIPPIGDSCFSESMIYVQVFDGTFKVFESTKQHENTRNEFDLEIYPGGSATSTLIRVINDSGTGIPNAEVCVSGTLKGKTDLYGQLFVDHVANGDKLAARILQHENASPREGHSEGSTRNWNYRVYNTSVSVQTDSHGNNVSLPLKNVADHTQVQVIRISNRNTLVGFNLVASIEWDATAADIKSYLDRIFETSELIYNATDGQFLIERITMTDNGSRWNDADIQILGSYNTVTRAHMKGIYGTGGHVFMNPNDGYYPGTYLHELGHYLFGVNDEYKSNGHWNHPGISPHCTLGDQDPDPIYHDHGDKHACPMQGATFGCNQKFCSAHPDNPHVDGTMQGPEDCWTTIKNLFHTWIIKTPVDRGVIVSKFPDSHVATGINTPIGLQSDAVGSYIPVRDWKPKWHTSSVNAPNERPNIKVMTRFDGQPVGGIGIWVKGTDNRNVYQGITFGHDKILSEGTSLLLGQTLLHGAHVGSVITALKAVTGGVLLASHTLTSADPGTIQLNLQMVPFADPFLSMVEAEEDELSTGIATVAVKPVSTSVTAVQPLMAPAHVAYQLPANSDLQAWSEDGQLEIYLPADSATEAGELYIDSLKGGPSLSKKDTRTIIGGPWRIHSSQGKLLEKPASLFIGPGNTMYKAEELHKHKLKLELVKYNEAKKEWRTIESSLISEPLTVTASVQELGVYALVAKHTK